jgi:hypothetical protein
MDPYTPDSTGRTRGDGDTRAGDYGQQSSFDSWSFKDILTEMGEQARRLVRAEVDLAKAELREEVTKVKASAGLIAGGGLVMFLGAIAFTCFAIAVLDTFMPLWLAAFIVTLLFAGAGAFALKKGLDSLKRVHKPTRTIQTLKEDSQWASRTVQSMKSQIQGHA